VVCLGPRDPGEIVGPRPLSGVVGRPLNFTVRGREEVVLSDVVRMLELLRTEQSQYMVPTIYAAEPWSPGSEALVDWASQKGGLPPEVSTRRMVRLIDVAGAVDLLKDRYFDLRAAGGYDELSDLLIQRVILRNSRQ
jgi:hypothetical protein